MCRYPVKHALSKGWLLYKQAEFHELTKQQTCDQTERVKNTRQAMANDRGLSAGRGI